MSNYLANTSDVAYEGILAKARDNANTKVIETRLLDGSHTVQTIGSAATKVSIEFHCSLAVRRLIEACASSATPLKAYGTDKVFTGIISGGEIKSDYSTPSTWKLTFDLLVTEVVDR